MKVRQDGVVSSFLFNILTDWTMNFATDKTNLGISLETSITDLNYADVICLLDDYPDGVQIVSNRVVDTANLVGLQLIESKTKFVFSCCESMLLYCYCEELENVTEFDCLGSRIT